MKTFWDAENNCRVYKCPVCQYEYHEYYDNRCKTNNDKPFIEMEEVLFYKKHHD